jgi:hydrogenase/urease accessory protein HupE
VSNRLSPWRSALICLLLVSAGAVEAHEVRPAYLQIDETAPDRFDVLWKQPANGTLAVHLEPTLSNHLLENRKPSAEFTSTSFVIRQWEKLPATRDSFDGATVRIDGLENTITDALVNISFLNGQQVQTVLKPSAPELLVHLKGAGKMPVPAYLGLGVEHILTGFDHLSFVLGLVLLIHGRWKLLKTITAFTVAHSITLAAAALGHVHVSPPVIESLVALSIVFVAVELGRAYRGHDGLTVHYPWLIAFTFGLLHGFAFAGSLADIGLPRHNIPGALLLFNCGVEIGQLLFVGAVLIIIYALHRTPMPRLRYVRWAAPYAIGTLASYWMFERMHVLIS